MLINEHYDDPIIVVTRSRVGTSLFKRKKVNLGVYLEDSADIIIEVLKLRRDEIVPW